MPATIEVVLPRGGKRVPVRCNHTVVDVEALSNRVRAEQGWLDLLVNNARGGHEGLPTGIATAPFWEQSRSQWPGMFVAGLRAHMMARQVAARLMLHGPGGLIVSTIAWSGGGSLGNVFYDVSRAAIVRMIWGMASDLRPYGVSALAPAPASCGRSG
jgi:NAD(P)-dependent dehydrogenase (short-subunit alcohol dehydrogenase family)